MSKALSANPFFNTPALGDEIVRFDNVVARYSNTENEASDAPSVLKHVTFSLQHGGFYFLTGPSGAGKSTLLKLLYLGMPPTVGMVKMFGRDVYSLKRDDMARLRRRIGVVFQDYRLIPHLTAFENVALPLRLAGIRRDDFQHDIVDLLKWVGLKGKEGALPSTLSGGEQQRIAIARAVVNKPALLLADEPTGNVDDAMAERLIKLFEQLNKLGTTVVIATHSQQLIRDFKKPALHLQNGKVVAPDAGPDNGPDESKGRAA